MAPVEVTGAIGTFGRRRAAAATSAKDQGATVASTAGTTVRVPPVADPIANAE